MIAEYNLKNCILNVSESRKQVSKLTLTSAWNNLKLNQTDVSDNKSLILEPRIEFQYKEGDLKDWINSDIADKGYEYLSENALVIEILSLEKQKI